MTEEVDFDGAPAYVLRAPDGTEATVVPSIGANCIALRVPRPAGDGMAHLLSTPRSAEALRGHPTGSGFPILSPHPSGGRTPFTWRGRSYQPPGRERLSGHGFAAGAAWEVLDAAEATLVCRLDSRTLDPGTTWWPWPYVITATHRVAPGELTLTLELENLASEPAPLMFGLHPYFPLRFVAPHAGGAGDAQQRGWALPTAAALVGEAEAAARQSCLVWVDAGTLWDRERNAAPGTIQPVGDRWNVRQPRSLADLANTAVQAGVASSDGRMPVILYTDTEALAAGSAGDDPAAPGGVASGVVDAAAGLALTLETSRAFGALALYTPPAHAAVSLEPRSSLIDALVLAEEQPDLATGLRAVLPGTPWRAWARLSLAPRTDGTEPSRLTLRG